MVIGPCLFAASIASRHECGRNFRRDPASRLSDPANVWIEVEVSRLGKGIVEVDITPEGHHEQRSVDGHEPRPPSQNA